MAIRGQSSRKKSTREGERLFTTENAENAEIIRGVGATVADPPKTPAVLCVLRVLCGESPYRVSSE
jgi:hypothetical protein